MTQIPRQNNSPRTSEQLKQLSECYSKLGHRQIALVSGEILWGWNTVFDYTESQPNTVLITNKTSLIQKMVSEKDIDITTIRPDKPSTMLGFNCSNAIIDCTGGFYPDALASIAGTIQPGGYLFIICPPLIEWPTRADEFAKKRTSHGQSAHSSSPNTINRFIEHCINGQAIILEQNQPDQPPAINEQVLDSTDLQSVIKNPNWSLPSTSTAEQLKVLTKISEHVQKQLLEKTTLESFSNAPTQLQSGSKQFHIIQADRGRGKSHLVGLIANSLMDENIDNGIKLYITAPTRLSIQSVFNALPDQESTSELANELEFIAPERVLETVRPNDILLVDEAASLPLPLLTAWSNVINTIIFSTTTHGYEGTGKGFQIRFIKHLESLTPNIHQHELSYPVRYADDDPLEKLIFANFCLNAEPKGLSLKKNQLESIPSISKNNVQIQCKEIHQQDLAKQPTLLEELFSLLVQAHYQTRPSDLRDILDSPNLIYGLFITLNNTTYLASACLISIEGGFNDKDTPLINSIMNGTRRPKGHLIPQVLTLHMGQAEALRLKGARVVRIATLPNLQTLNYGSQLLHFTYNQLMKSKYDYIGSSYADTPDVNAFWIKNTFEVIRTGNKLDKSSGTRSKLVFKGLTRKGSELLSNCKYFYEGQKNTYKNFQDTPQTDQTLINIFINETGSYEAIKDILNRCENWAQFYNKQLPKKASAEFRQVVKDWSID